MGVLRFQSQCLLQKIFGLRQTVFSNTLDGLLRKFLIGLSGKGYGKDGEKKEKEMLPPYPLFQKKGNNDSFSIHK